MATAALTTSASAGYRSMVFSVDVSGAHHVDWKWQDPYGPEPCNDWTNAAGSQTTGFSHVRPAKYVATVSTGKTLKGLPKGAKVPGVAWSPSGQAKVKMTVTRKVTDLEPHLAPGSCTPCEQEGGGCAPPVDRQPQLPETDCARRTLKGAGVGIAYVPEGFAEAEDGLPKLGEDALRVAPFSPLDREAYKACYPELLPTRQHLETPEPLPIQIRSAARVLRLRVGGKVTYNASRELGTWLLAGKVMTEEHCTPPEGPQYGYVECAVTDITVKIKRLK